MQRNIIVKFFKRIQKTSVLIRMLWQELVCLKYFCKCQFVQLQLFEGFGNNRQHAMLYLMVDEMTSVCQKNAIYEYIGRRKLREISVSGEKNCLPEEGKISIRSGISGKISPIMWTCVLCFMMHMSLTFTQAMPQRSKLVHTTTYSFKK